ncbi:MAG: tetratricopeptide repeat protein [Methanoregula sp.]|jgi:tetratricopeptide (TPR) repeat protein|nr:tetratricopeptide repeat protein [Methanoregula sp.]
MTDPAFSSASVENRKIDNLIELLHQLYKDEQWENVFYLGEYIATLVPEDPNVHRAMGLSLLWLGDWDRSEKCFLKSLECGDNDPEIYLLISTIYSFRGDLDGEIFWLNKALEEDKENPKVNFRLAIAYISIGELDKSEGILKNLVLAHPDHTNARRALADIYLHTRKLEAAEEQLREAVSNVKDNHILYSDLGRIFSIRKNYSEALKCHFRALELDRNNAKHYYDIGDNYIASGEPENAVTYLRKADELNSFDPHIQYDLGRAYFDLERYQECLTASRSAMQNDPDMKMGRTNLGLNAMQAIGLSYMNLGKYEEAETCFRKNITLIAPTFFNLGLSLHRQGNYDMSLKYFTWAVELIPDDAEYWDLVGNAYIELNRLAEAEESLKTAIRVDNTYSLAHYDLGVVLARVKGNDAAALKSFRRAISLDSKNPYSYYAVSCLYATQGKRKLALEYLEDAIKHGYKDREYLDKDTDLDSLRGDLKFQEIIGRIKIPQAPDF